MDGIQILMIGSMFVAVCGIAFCLGRAYS